MQLDRDAVDDDEVTICQNCVGESYLKNLIVKEGKARECRYCEEVDASFTLEEMADVIESAFERHFERTSTDMDGFQYAMHKDPESDYSWERDGEPTADAIMNAAEIDEDIAEDIQRILGDRYGDFESAQMGEETAFAEEAHYTEIMPDGAEWREAWLDFERSIKSEARFFNRAAADQLAELFDGIDQVRTRGGASLLVHAGPGKKIDHLFRARVFQSDKALCKALERPDRELSAPPSELAVAGRMNAKGISTFYGATDEKIALAEVRPPVGSQVAMARFDIIRPLRLLDLNAMSQIQEHGSIFDPTYASRLSRMMFLRSFCARISRPVMPDDQDVEYLVTQAIADYLATESKVPLDGILFPSVQAGGKGLNVVLFQKASRCEQMPVAEGAELEASTGSRYEDGWEREYSVIERLRPEGARRKSQSAGKRGLYDLPKRNPRLYDLRESTLRVDVKSISVAVIGSVKYASSTHSVKRNSFTQSDEELF